MGIAARLFANTWRRIATALGVIILLYTVGGFVLLPMLVRSVAVRQLTVGLGRNVTIRKVQLNPYTLSVTVQGFQIDEPNGEALLSWDVFYADFELWSSLVHRTWVFGDAALVGPHLHIVRDAEGKLNFADLLLLNWPTVPQFRLGMMRLAGGEVVVDDAALSSRFSMTIGSLNGSFVDFSMSPDHENAYSFTAVSEAGERFAWNGFFRLDPLSSHGELAAEDIRIGKYYPYLEDLLDLTIADGTLTARTTYDLDLSPDHFQAVLSDGTIAARSLRVVERENETPLLGLAELTLSGAHVDLVQQKIEVAAIIIAGGSVGLRRLTDHSFNVQHVLKSAPTPSPAKASTSNSWQVSVGEIRLADFSAEVSHLFGRETVEWKELRILEPAFRMNPFAASIAAVTLGGGKLSFADRSSSPPVAVALTDLDIRIGALSVEDPRGASVSVKAKIERGAELQISGKTNPIHKQGETNIRGLLQDVNLVPLSPYAARYLGYEIKEGKLTLDVKCSIQHRQLNLQGRVEIAQLTLGERTDSKDATNLPVRLALALLKNMKGNIILDVPITGTLDDPKFEPTKAIVLAVLNPFTHITTAPFAALGAQLGGGGEELSFQTFAPGSAHLSPLEASKLDKIVQAMKRWPELTIDVRGSVDAEKDSGNLQLLAADRAKAVGEYLHSRGVLDPSRIIVVDNSVASVPREGSRALLRVR